MFFFFFFFLSHNPGSMCAYMLMLMEEFIASQFIYFFSQVTPIHILINYLFKFSAQYLITEKKKKSSA